MAGGEQERIAKLEAEVARLKAMRKHELAKYEESKAALTMSIEVFAVSNSKLVRPSHC